MARPCRVLLRGLAVLVLLAGLLPTWAQPPPPSPTGEPPGSIKEAYGQAERFGPEEAAAGPQAPGEGRKGSSLWLDGVHGLGIAAGALMVVALSLGLTLFFGARAGTARFPVKRRKGRRKWHYAVGLTALSLGLLHTGLRLVQLGEFQLGRPVRDLGGAMILLALSGMVRAWPPRRLARYPRIWIWTHRVLVVLAVYVVARHVFYQVRAFLG